MSHSSIGNMTNTQIETGSRHMQQCRTNYDVLLAVAGSESELLNNDDKWCMAKDELAVACTKHLCANTAKTATKYAYPSVITTLGPMDANEKTFLASHYHFMGENNSEELVQHSFDATKPTDKASQYRQFIPVGYSVGRACAHGYKGDTVASVQIGGLRTVMNGAFDVQTGDLIQMYVPDAEDKLFTKNGGRKALVSIDALKNVVNTPVAAVTGNEAKRRDFYSRGNGIGAKGGTDRVKTGMFSIKPYMESQNENALQYYGDKVRVFARAVSSARPFEPVDIMIARQSM
jgi:hypothetical protein